MNILLNTMAIFLIAVTLAPSLPSKHWLVRVWEFPRLQLLGLMVIVIIARGVMYPSELSGFNTLISAMLYIGLIACAIYQTIWILPYTLQKKWLKQFLKMRVRALVSYRAMSLCPMKITTSYKSMYVTPIQTSSLLLNLTSAGK